MKKILGYVTEEEKNQSVMLKSRQSTLVTLLSINKYNLDKNKIREELVEAEKQTNNFWFYITDKYNIPYYADKQMHLDILNNCIYIDI